MLATKLVRESTIDIYAPSNVCHLSHKDAIEERNLLLTVTVVAHG
jgi:hypothetical protein